MKILQLGFSVPNHLKFPIVSWLVRAVMGWTPYSHIYGRWFVKSIGEWNCFHATGAGGVHMLGSPEFKRTVRPIRIYELELEAGEFQELLKFAVHNNGRKYAHLQNVGIWWSIVWGLKENPFSKGETRQNCSELWGRILAKRGMVFDKSFDLLTPKDIEDALIRLKVRRVK